MKFNEKLILLRKQKGYSQEALAEKLEVSRQAISRWENGETTPEMASIIKLCGIYNVSADCLLMEGDNIASVKDNTENILEGQGSIDSDLLLPVKTPWFSVGNFVLFLLGIPLFVVGVIIRVINGNPAGLINGCVWVVLGLLLFLKGIYNKQKLSKLEKNGSCMDCTVTKIVPLYYVRINNYLTARVEGIYMNQEDKISVKSGVYLFNHAEKVSNLYGKIYVDKNNNKNYMVVLYRKKDVYSI